MIKKSGRRMQATFSDRPADWSNVAILFKDLQLPTFRCASLWLTVARENVA